MSDHLAWRPLPVSATGIPNLLVSSYFTSQSYTVYITDLANVWAETMDRKRLVRRGLEKDISIDLTDGADQIRRMLDYLRAAFEPGDSEHKNTTLSLCGDDNDDSLVLQVTCVLPKVLNLKPLEWPIILKQKPQSTVAPAVVLPLIQAQQERSRDIEKLTTMLKNKDAVITKLVDKLDSTGTRLEHVFSTLAGKRRVTRELAEQRIKGLAPFNEADFKSKEMGGGDDDTYDVASLLASVFDGHALKSEFELDGTIPQDNWWKGLGHGRSATLVDRKKGRETEVAQSPAKPSSEDEDDFQVQPTPPRGNRTRGASPMAVPQEQPMDDETCSDDDSDDLGGPSAPVSQHRGPPSRIGAIGGKKLSPAPASPRRSTPTLPSPKNPSHNGSDTASDSDDSAKAPGPPASSKTHTSPQSKPGGIGRIGGIYPLSGKPKDDSPPTTRSSRSTPEKVRGRPHNATEAHAESKYGDMDKSKARETSTERADQKRRDLRRERESRSAAGPAKKKRRF